jgi:hypothetical protein
MAAFRAECDPKKFFISSLPRRSGSKAIKVRQDRTQWEASDEVIVTSTQVKGEENLHEIQAVAQVFGGDGAVDAHSGLA